MTLKPNILLVASILLTLAVAVADLALWQRELSSSVFYLLPVALAGWTCRLRGAVLTAVLAALAWHVVEILRQSYTIPAAPYWNTGVRMAFFVLCVVLISHSRRSLERERQLADADGLTGVANSRHFYEELEREIGRFGRGGRSFAVAFLDLDGFKKVNDEHGHLAGDELLRRIANTLPDGLRPTDVVARLGGDEFGLILAETDEEGAAATLERLRLRLAEVVGQAEPPVTCSIGAVVVRAMPHDHMELVRRADALMYRVKRGGRNDIKIDTFG